MKRKRALLKYDDAPPDSSGLEVAVYLADEVDAVLKLIACQDEGCGGNLNPEEIYRAMQRLALEAATR